MKQKYNAFDTKPSLIFYTIDFFIFPNSYDKRSKQLLLHHMHSENLRVLSESPCANFFYLFFSFFFLSIQSGIFSVHYTNIDSIYFYRLLRQLFSRILFIFNSISIQKIYYVCVIIKHLKQFKRYLQRILIY